MAYCISLRPSGMRSCMVSHRLRDILAVCTRIVVLSGGRVMLDRPAQGFTLTELSEALAPGLARGGTERLERVTSSDPILELSWRHQDLAFARGEIVGLFGMAAGPQFQLLQALYGVGQGLQAKLLGVPFSPHSPGDAIDRGVFYVSADRERDGLLVDMSALDNLVLPWLDLYRRWLAFSHARAALSL